MYPDENVAGKSWQTRQLQLGLNIHRRHIRKFCDQSLNIVDKLSNLAFNKSRWPKETYGVAAVVMDVDTFKVLQAIHTGHQTDILSVKASVGRQEALKAVEEHMEEVRQYNIHFCRIVVAVWKCYDLLLDVAEKLLDLTSNIHEGLGESDVLVPFEHDGVMM